MVPVSRVLQYLFLLAGLALLGVGIFMAKGQHSDTYVNFVWECQGGQGKQTCMDHSTSDNGDYTTYGAEYTPIAVSLAGVGLIVGSVSVGLISVAGRTGAAGAAPAPGGAGSPAAGYAQHVPPQTPPAPAPAPPRQEPGRPGGY